jgi:hypothetical protein
MCDRMDCIPNAGIVSCSPEQTLPLDGFTISVAETSYTLQNIRERTHMLPKTLV